MKASGLTMFCFLLIVLSSWGFNLKKLIDCDFETPYKCEAVHVIGLIPIASIITVWFDPEETAKKATP